MTTRHTGILKNCNVNRGFGFVTIDGYHRDIFVHASKMPANKNPVDGERIEFSIYTKPDGKYEARDIKLITDQQNKRSHASNMNQSQKIDRRKQIRSGKQSVKDRILPAPYTFVPVAIKQRDNGNEQVASSIRSVPGHDGQSCGERWSGELRVCMQNLTPLMVGARRYKWKNPPEEYKDPEKTYRYILQPWMLSDGRVVIPGSSIKGMIRHYISALLNTPMERVAEQYFSYRPNLDMRGRPGMFKDEKGEYRIEMRESIVKEVDMDCIKIRVLPHGRNSLFVQNDIMCNNRSLRIGDQINRGAEIKNANRPVKRANNNVVTDNNGKPVYLHKIVQHTSNHWSSDDDYELYRYHGGMDRHGEMARLHGSPPHTYNYVITKTSAIKQAKDFAISSELISEYRRTYTELQDTTYGHLSARHPKLVRDDENNNNKPVPTLLKISQNENLFKKDTLIYTEVKIRKDGEGKDYIDDILTFGHHFHYRWSYRDSIHYLDRPQSKRLRPELSVQQDEVVDHDGGELTATRSIFGYTAAEGHFPNRFKKSFTRLAGRISVNHALEEVELPPKLTRFLNSGECLVLKELGSPKASAVEFYIDQTKYKINNRLNTYGDTRHECDSRLAGRKFYRHQKDAATDESVYRATTPDEIRNWRATIVRYASNPGSKFKFTVRFQDLDSIELAALLIVLNIHRSDTYTKAESTVSNDKELIPQYALKLGYARPLGFGSVITRINSVRLVKPKTAKNESILCIDDVKDVELWSDKIIRQCIEEHPARLSNLDYCLWAWEYKNTERADYPKAKDKDGNDNIYEYHTNVRRRHAQARRTGKLAGFDDAYRRHVQRKKSNS